MPGKPSPIPPAIVQPPLPAPVTTGWEDLVDAERTKVDLKNCRADTGLTTIAQSWANRMNQVGVLSHDGFAQRIAGCNLAGEVVEKAISPQEAMARWMKSKDHRDIILDPKYARFGAASSGNFHCLVFADDTGKK